jgi:hypothetical protein
MTEYKIYKQYHNKCAVFSFLTLLWLQNIISSATLSDKVLIIYYNY